MRQGWCEGRKEDGCSEIGVLRGGTIALRDGVVAFD